MFKGFYFHKFVLIVNICCYLEKKLTVKLEIVTYTQFVSFFFFYFSSTLL